MSYQPRRPAAAALLTQELDMVWAELEIRGIDPGYAEVLVAEAERFRAGGSLPWRQAPAGGGTWGCWGRGRHVHLLAPGGPDGWWQLWDGDDCDCNRGCGCPTCVLEQQP